MFLVVLHSQASEGRLRDAVLRRAFAVENVAVSMFSAAGVLALFFLRNTDVPSCRRTEEARVDQRSLGL